MARYFIASMRLLSSSPAVKCCQCTTKRMTSYHLCITTRRLVISSSSTRSDPPSTSRTIVTSTNTTTAFIQQHVNIRNDRNTGNLSKSSHGNGNDSDDSNNNNLGARKLFQQTPVHPSILQYIRSIGVGIAPRDTSGRNQKKRFSYNYVKDQLDHTPSNLRKSRPLQHERQQLKSSQHPDEHNSRNDEWIWMPPPPFGPKSLPVRMIGQVGPEAVVVTDGATSPPSTTVATKATDTSNLTSNSVTGTTATNSTINMNAFPKNLSQIPEIAVMGRSNVGKSTLLNALLYGNRDSSCVIRAQHKQKGQVPNNMKLPKGIKAVMSNRPGETRHISFYKLQHMSDVEQQEEDSTNHNNSTITMIPKQPPRQENRSLLLVDLPGYGFAYAKEEDATAYRTLMCHYLLHRGKALQRVLLLIDARHGLKKADIDFLTMLEEQHIQSIQNSDQATSRKSYTIPFPIQIVLTKCDLVTQSDLARRVTQVRQQLSDVIRREPGQLPVMLVSARPGVGYNNVDPKRHIARGGILELQKELAALAQPKIMEIHKNETKAKPTTNILSKREQRIGNV